MAGFDPTQLMRGLWSSLVGGPGFPSPPRPSAGGQPYASWQSWLAREQARLPATGEPRARHRSPTSPLVDLSLPDLPASSLLQGPPRSWMDSLLGVMTWGRQRVARLEDEWPAGRAAGEPAPKVDRPTAGRAGSPKKVARSVSSGQLVPNQFDPSLSAREAYAACGPAAAVACARAAGRSPSLRQALELAKTVGWTAEGGMNGVHNQKRLLEKMGLRARLDTSGDWNRIAKLAEAGTPVTISTPGHYFVADGYDPGTGRFHVGASGTAYRNGKEWMTRQEIERLAGSLNGVLTVDARQEWSV